MNILSKFKPIRLFVLDVDGVLTDGTLVLFDNGEQARRMNIKDGYALQLAVKKGYEFLIVSGGTSEAVRLRLEKLGIQNIHLAVKDKAALISRTISDKNLSAEQVLFMGDDIPDLEPMKLAGLSCAPYDAVPEIRAAAQYISPYKGGEGCVRDVIEKVLKLNGDWNDDTFVTSQ